MTEDQLEILALDWFKEQGYSYAFGPEIGHDGEKPERNERFMRWAHHKQ